MSGSESTTLVAVGGGPGSAHLIRWTRDLAARSGGSWLAVYVDTGATLSPRERRSLDANLELARSLGARVEVLPGRDVAAAILDAARGRDADLIVVGRSGAVRAGRLPLRPGISERLVRAAGPLPVAVVQGGAEGPGPRAAAESEPRTAVREWAMAAAAAAVLIPLGLLLAPFISYHGVALVYLAAVLALSLLAGPAVSAGSAFLSALALNFFLIPPRYTLTIGTPEDWLLFGVYFLVAFVTAGLVGRLRSRERMLAQRQAASAFLLEAAERLAPRDSAEEAAREAAQLAGEHFGLGIAFMVGAPEGPRRALAAGSMSGAGAAAFEELCRSPGYQAAEAPSGGGARVRAVPAPAPGPGRVVAGVELPPGRAWTVSDDDLLVSLSRTLSLIARREASERESRRASLELGSQRLAKTLLDSVSHEMRTPLTTITGSISALRDDDFAGRPGDRRDLLDGALAAAAALDRIVEDLLSASRIESGLLRLRREPAELGEIARMAVADCGPALGDRRLEVSLPEEPVSANVDQPLVSRLAANLLRNAARYSRPGGRVRLALSADGPDLVVRVEDEGPGPAPERLAGLFDKLKPAPGGSRGGLGLGLAICKGVAEAHGGTIAATAGRGRFAVEARFPACVAAAGAEAP